jgi:hypothetical protein
MFSPGTHVRFRTALGECLGTVEKIHSQAFGGDFVYSVRPDDHSFPVILVRGRSLQLVADEADVPLVLVVTVDLARGLLATFHMLFKSVDRVLYNGCLGTVLNYGGRGMYAVRMDGIVPIYFVPLECLVPDPDPADVPIVVMAS